MSAASTAHTHGGVGEGAAANLSHRRRLVISLALTLVVLGIELIGALVSGSLALLADSAHVLTDGTGLTLAIIAATLAAKPATRLHTFGWKRAEILAALANGLLMLAVCVFVVVEGVQRLFSPPTVEAPIMMAAAILGLVVNVTVMSLLAHSSKDNLNMRGAYLEVWGDAVGQVFVIITSIVIATTGFTQADGIASLAIGALILPRGVILLKAALRVLLEATPKNVDVGALRSHLGALPGVVEIHDLHVWTITSNMPSLTVHARIDPEYAQDIMNGKMLARFQACVSTHFDVTHSTFQFEVDSPPITPEATACDALHR